MPRAHDTLKILCLHKRFSNNNSGLRPPCIYKRSVHLLSWKMGIYKIVCLLLLLPVLLGGCGASSSLVRYDISGDVESLDPQFLPMRKNEQLVIYNIMEGLMCQLPSGELTNGRHRRVRCVRRPAHLYLSSARRHGLGRRRQHTGHRPRLCLCLPAHLQQHLPLPPSPRSTAPSGTASRCSPASCRQASSACRPPTTSPSSLP